MSQPAPRNSTPPASNRGSKRPEPKGPGKKRKGGAHALSGHSVLLVEDDAASRKLEAVLLTDAGALVTAVDSAEEAIAVLARRKPDAVVLDLILPRMGGLVLVEQLKTDPATKDIVVIAVTSLNGADAERVALRAGCAAYLKKPIDTQTFAATVASYLGGQR
jgi:CheY-like chemotaxis protein